MARRNISAEERERLKRIWDYTDEQIRDSSCPYLRRYLLPTARKDKVAPKGL